MVTAKKSGAEVIPFIKTYVNLPAAIGFTALYSKLCDKMEQRDVFYACTIPFLIFFMAFAFVIYPNVGLLHPHAFVDKIASALPAGFAAPLAIVRNWSFAVFYVMAEMWGSVVASLLFWSFANEVTTVEEAKKYCECGRYCVLVGVFVVIWNDMSLTSPPSRFPCYARPVVRTGCQCRAHLLRSVCALRFRASCQPPSRRRSMGYVSEISNGSGLRLWWMSR